MKAEIWQKIHEIFNDAAELPFAERDEFLSESCETAEIRNEVLKLLVAEDAANNFLEEPAIDFETPKTYKKIGRYKIISELGKGGMGSVFLAEREDLPQKVAVKIIKRGLDSEDILRRFHHEREILAALEHPNIARLIDGGTTDDGLPFYVMEYVEGIPIDEYCTNLDLNDKLQLFRQVCKAVSFAHARLIVHRDLKPSNIIVDQEGTAKLLDFGIAKLLSEDNFGQKGTATSLGMMTPNYASPEQFRGENVTTATDIYSLGVILYEMLTGILPYDLKDKTLDKVFEILNETATTKPSENPKSEIQNPKSLKGDLDNIVLKSLKKEPERRYQSVKDFSEDIRRHLVGLPVAARPDTFRYRASKFVQRNKISVAAAVVVFISLIAGISVATWQAVVAKRQKALAEKRFADVRELANKVVFRYHDEIAKFPGATALREELVNDAVRYLDSLNAEQIEDNQLKLELAKAYEKIGDVQGRPYAANLGKSEDALKSYQKAVEILKNAAERSPQEFELKRELVRAMIRLVALKARLSAEDFQNELDAIVNLQTEVNEADRSNADQNAVELAEAYILKGDYIWANPSVRLEIYRKAFALLENIPDKTLETQHQFSRVCQRLGSNFVWFGDDLLKKGEKEKALENYRNALPFNEKMFDSIKAEIALEGETQNLQRLFAGANQNLGENYAKLGETEKGLQMLEKNLEISLKLAKADEKNTEALLDVANAFTSFVDAFRQNGAFEKALVYNTKALEILENLSSAGIKNIETTAPLIKRLHAQAELLEKTKRFGAATYLEKINELCRNEMNKSPCIEIGQISP
ncbi:MAG TPA: serine/threonine-protein kinase [Pyrinomonadaceae bacterium]|nr:serine/threonine-protein kinase [Pyrinomonadaceae bacterium]